MYISKILLSLDKDISAFKREDLNDERAKKAFDYSHDIITKFDKEFFNISKIFKESMTFDWDFQDSFELILFKTIVGAYIEKLNATLSNLTNLAKLSIDSMEVRLQSMIGNNPVVFEQMTDKLKSLPDDFKAETIESVKSLKSLIDSNSLSHEISFDVDESFLDEQVEKASAEMNAYIKQKLPSNGGCYIATMAYGDYDHPQVLELRKFRDEFLDKFYLGKQFIKFYYKYSPKLVEKLENKQSINNAIRRSLDQFVKLIKKKK